MVKLIRTLAPENGMNFDEIGCFQTASYVGFWNHELGRYALVAKSDVEFHLVHLQPCKNLDELDDRVYGQCEEHIISVSDRAEYEINLTEG